jgi:prephenate dehydrogenase
VIGRLKTMIAERDGAALERVFRRASEARLAWPQRVASGNATGAQSE